jgi:hypothetical protein
MQYTGMLGLYILVTEGMPQGEGHVRVVGENCGPEDYTSEPYERNYASVASSNENLVVIDQ